MLDGGVGGGVLWILVCLVSLLLQAWVILQYLRSKPTHAVSLTDLVTTDLLCAIVVAGVACIVINCVFMFDVTPPR